MLWFLGPVHYQQITILHASLVHRFTAGAQKEGGCRSADAIAVQIQFLLSIISGRRRKTGLATIGKPEVQTIRRLVTESEVAVAGNSKFRFVGADAFSPDELRTDLFSDDEGGYLWPQEDDSSEAEHSMTEQKRPVLTLKRKTEGETLVRSRKTIINVTTPPKWKVKKQKLAEKAAREAELAAKKAQARQALSIYLNLPTLDDAVNTLKPWWPGLFDGDTPRLLACGIRDVLLEDVAQRNIPLSHKKLRRALKAITRSESYLCAMKAGACRYDTEGYVTEHISQEEEAYAAERLDKIRRQNRIKAELQAVLDEK